MVRRFSIALLLVAFVSAADSTTAFRPRSPQGLQKLLGEHDLAVEQSSNPDSDGDIKWLRRAIDEMAGQKDAHVSRLFWHTDLSVAQSESKASGKPILSLRLLGRLDTDLSCANSRFFRTALYSNRAISDYLRDNYVLHWQSMRPVPVVTIDMGDGRTIKRTITGNSIHYVLSPDGSIIDAVTGLVAPGTFLEVLHDARGIAATLANTAPEANRASVLRSIHARKAGELLRGMTGPEVLAKPAVAAGGAAFPNARNAGERSFSKVSVERKLVAAVTPATPIFSLHGNPQQPSPAIVAAYANASRLDGSSMALMRTKLAGKSHAEFSETLRSFEASIAQDTAYNQHNFRPRILAWLATGETGSLDALNERVYAELFLTPSSDPWLGLAPRDAYSALDGDGLEECRED